MASEDLSTGRAAIFEERAPEPLAVSFRPGLKAKADNCVAERPGDSQPREVWAPVTSDVPSQPQSQQRRVLFPRRYFHCPADSSELAYDPPAVMNADTLSYCQKEAWCKLAFYLLSFFYYLYW